MASQPPGGSDWNSNGQTPPTQGQWGAPPQPGAPHGQWGQPPGAPQGQQGWQQPGAPHGQQGWQQPGAPQGQQGWQQPPVQQGWQQQPHGFQQPHGAMQASGSTNMVYPKGSESPGVAALLSFFFPGVGQMILGQTTKGAVMLGVSFFTGGLCGILCIVGAIDAYQIGNKLKQGRPVEEWEWF